MGAWQNGSTRAWRRLRAAVLARDRAVCRAHGDGWCARARTAGRNGEHTCIRTATHAHHTHGRSATGDDPRFIVAACEPCNLYIGDPAALADPSAQPVTKW
jgi:hypothetical protein